MRDLWEVEKIVARGHGAIFMNAAGKQIEPPAWQFARLECDLARRAPGGSGGPYFQLLFKYL